MSMRADGFHFNVKQWLGDDAILLMDWDVRAMHLHLMCLAWQQDEPGTLPNDEALLRRWVGGISSDEWLSRVRPQILRAWKTSGSRLVQEGLRREWERQSSNSKKRQAAARVRWDKPRSDDQGESSPPLSPSSLPPDANEAVDPEGFRLSELLRENSLFREEASSAERSTIWGVGVELIRHEGFEEPKARALLGKIIHTYGEKTVAEAIAHLALRRLPPADAKSYLMGMLKTEKAKGKRRGSVAL